MKTILKQYIEIGWRVFPILKNSKIPIPKTNGIKDSTNEMEKINDFLEKNKDCNLGLELGEKSNVFVVDISCGKNKLFDVIGKIPQTLSQKTPNRGLHLFFKYPKNMVLFKKTISDGIDILGTGQYVLLPPSVINGKKYEWIKINNKTSFKLLNAPKKLLSMWFK